MCIFVLVFLSYPYFPSLPAFPRIPFKPKERKDTNTRGKERVRAQRALMRSLTPPPPSLLQSINKKLKPGSQLSPSTCTDLFHCSCHLFSFLLPSLLSHSLPTFPLSIRHPFSSSPTPRPSLFCPPLLSLALRPSLLLYVFRPPFHSLPPPSISPSFFLSLLPRLIPPKPV